MGAVGIASLCAALLAVVCVLLLLLLLRHDRRWRGEVVAARAETALLQDRLAELEQSTARQHAAITVPAEFLITDAGTESAEASTTGVPDRLVLTATLGEPLVKAVALSHGLRRALSAESRNRIRFAMRQELRRTRRRRRREMKQAWRQMQTEKRSAGDAA